MIAQVILVAARDALATGSPTGPRASGTEIVGTAMPFSPGDALTRGAATSRAARGSSSSIRVMAPGRRHDRQPRGCPRRSVRRHRRRDGSLLRRPAALRARGSRGRGRARLRQLRLPARRRAGARAARREAAPAPTASPSGGAWCSATRAPTGPPRRAVALDLPATRLRPRRTRPACATAPGWLVATPIASPTASPVGTWLARPVKKSPGCQVTGPMATTRTMTPMRSGHAGSA